MQLAAAVPEKRAALIVAVAERRADGTPAPAAACVYVPQKVAITDGTQLLVWMGPA